MKSKTLIFAIAAGFPLGPAFALDVSSSAVVEATPDKVWEQIGDFCAIQNWHPAVSTCEQMEEGGATYRILTTTDGGTIKEKLVEQTETSYTYEIIESPLPVENYQSTISIAPEGAGTKINWSSSFDAKGASDDEASSVIEGIYKAGLDEIAKTSGN